MNKNLWICSMASLLMFSCSDSVNDGPEIEDSGADLSDLYIERDIQDLASDDAQKVAMLFNGGNDPASRAAMATPQVEVVSDSETSAPLLYIVNFGDNEGFALISATKNTSPVLAYSETGHFDPTIYNEPYEDLKTLAKYSIQDYGDSLRAKYALEWAIYEKPVMPNVTKMSRAMNPGTNLSTEELIKNEIARKQAEGYTYVGPIASIQVHLSADEYANLIRDISTHTNPNYNYEEVSLFFLKKNTEYSGPYLTTLWHQGYPFNIDAENIANGSNKNYAGCVPIAVGQITYYYKYPSKYDWSKIYVNPVLNDEFKYFIKDIRSICNVKYKIGETTATYEDAKSAFKELGYNVQDGGTPTFASLKTRMQERPGPIFICGWQQSSNTGHAWVCDGFKTQELSASVSYITSGFSPTGTPYEDYPVYSIKPFTPELHMNVGWGNNTNAWYTSPTVVPNDGKPYFSCNQQTIYVWK